MFFLICFTLSHQSFNITSNSLRSLILYFLPRRSIEVDVSYEFQTYFSDFSKAKGLTIEIQTNDSSKFGPFNHRSHLDGIDFHPDNIDYKLSFMNEGDYNVQVAMVFGENLEYSLDIINQNFSKFKFPITNYPSQKFTYFNSAGLIFHEKKYSLGLFIGVSIALIVLLIVIIIMGLIDY